MAESACAQVGVAVSGASTGLSHSLTNVLMTFEGWLMKWKVDVMKQFRIFEHVTQRLMSACIKFMVLLILTTETS